MDRGGLYMNDILQKPMDHARMTAVLQQLKSPQLRVSHIGSSARGRAIPVVTLGSGEQPSSSSAAYTVWNG